MNTSTFYIYVHEYNVHLWILMIHKISKMDIPFYMSIIINVHAYIHVPIYAYMYTQMFICS
jgi:hypothetical protein